MKIRNLAVIQVRTDSKRLPRKALLPLAGIPMIGFMIKRLESSKLIDKIIVATTKSNPDDQLCAYLSSIGTDFFRGSTNDVLERVFYAAKGFEPKTVIRLTGDCPLIDTKIIDQLITKYYKNNADYANLDLSFAEGLDAEVIDFKVLKVCHHEARLISQREHITQYIHNNKYRFKMISLHNSIDDSMIRIVVDEKIDYEVVTKIVNNLNRLFTKPTYSFAEIKSFLLREPGLLNLNSHVIRNEGLIKSLASDGLFKS